MKKTCLNISKFTYKLNQYNIFNSLSLSLTHSSFNQVINEEGLFNILSKAVLNLTDSKIKASLFNSKIENSFEEIGYYNSDIDLYKDMTIKDLFKYSSAFYKNDYSSSLEVLINDFNINVKDKISDLDNEHYEIIKLIDSLYHNPSLLILDNPFKCLSNENKMILINHLTHLKESGTTILMYSPNISEMYNDTNNYYIFEGGKLTNILNLKNKKYTVKLDRELELSKIFNKENDTITFIGTFIPIFDYLKKKDVNIISIKVGDIL